MSSEKIWVSLDLGYASIGWTAAKRGDDPLAPEVLGAGSVFFEPDRCLASDRRTFRRQRRHVRATRTRIRRMKEFLLAQGVITPEIAEEQHLASNPWELAAEALQGKKVLTPAELWAVLLWYAHNRGYDGNRLWSRHSQNASGGSDGGEAQEAKEDAKRVKEAKKQMEALHTATMAETVLAIEEADMEKWCQAKGSTEGLGYKARRMAFDRDTVVKEVRRILEAHLAPAIPGLTAEVVRLLLADPVKEPDALRGVEGIPRIYLGGYLFGQVRPRFDNRILTPCPITGEHTPSKTSDAFLAFRWAHLLSTVRVGRGVLSKEGRGLYKSEMEELNKHMEKYGRFTPGDFKKKVRKLTGGTEENDNLEKLFMVPGSDERLIRYPGLALLDKKFGMDAFEEDENSQKTLRLLSHKLALGKKVSKEEIKPLLKDPKQAEKKTIKYPLSAELSKLSGRAPYTSSVLKKITEEIFAGKDPWAEGGTLDKKQEKPDPLTSEAFFTEALAKAPKKNSRQVLEEQIDRETNNHLVRHRIKILTRLLQDIVKTYAGDDPSRVENIVIEVSRDLRDFSGMKAKQVTAEINNRRRPWLNAQEELAKDLGRSVESLTPGSVRKARIARAMGYTCPYTGKKFDSQDIAGKNVDLDHIIPHSKRQTDALDDLVLTFRQVNEMKGNRTAVQFIREEGGNPVPGTSLTLFTKEQFEKYVDALRWTPGTEDKKIFDKRKENLLMPTADDAGMTPGMGTQTSVINKLAQRAIVGWFRSRKCAFKQTRIKTVPSAITSEVRSQFDLLGILAESDSRLTVTYQETKTDVETGELIPVGEPKTKTIPKGEMRDLTHMHHAVDAIAILLTRMLLSTDDEDETTRLWNAMRKRHAYGEDRARLEATHLFTFSNDNKFKLRDDLPDTLMASIRKALGELRTVPYFSKRVGRLDITQNQWRVEKVENGKVTLSQRNATTGKKDKKEPLEDNVFGLYPKGGKGKLKANKAVYMFPSNYAIAYYDDLSIGKPEVIRSCHIWRQIEDYAKAHGGKKPHLLRKGDLVKIKRDGEWYIWSVDSIMNDARDGILLDLAFPYSAEGRLSGVTYFLRNRRFTNLLKNKAFRRLTHNLTGVPAKPIKPETQTKPPRGRKKTKGKACPTTSSKSPDTNAQLSLPEMDS